MRSETLVIEPYPDIWESPVEGSLRVDRNNLLAEAVEVTEARTAVSSATPVETFTPTQDVVAGLDELHAVVVVGSMPAPPSTAMVVLDLPPRSTVGGPMVGRALPRLGRPFSDIASTLERPDWITAEVRRAVVVGRVTGAKVLRVGEPDPDFTTVIAPPGGPGVMRDA